MWALPKYCVIPSPLRAPSEAQGSQTSAEQSILIVRPIFLLILQCSGEKEGASPDPLRFYSIIPFI